MINYNQEFKIYGRKKGRKNLNKFNIELINKFLLKNSFNLKKNIILDIGSGYGENSINLSAKYDDHIIIASEIYKDGNINLAKYLYKNNIQNVRIYNKNVLILFRDFNFNNLINEIWILFPDPWPKKRHHKRRLISKEFVEKIRILLNKRKFIYIATDSIPYLRYILRVFCESRSFEWINDLPHKWNYGQNINIRTKYFIQALRNKKKSFIFIFKKI